VRTITSDRLLLRPWRADDADFLVDLDYGSAKQLFERRAPR